ncbi:MAG: protealysin inhibitor emfourin [Amnibacterium sp.]
MTRIVVTRSGGFAGLTRTTEVTDAATVAQILEALRAHPATDAPPRPDAFVYDFAVEEESATTETYTLPESALPSGLRALLG